MPKTKTVDMAQHPIRSRVLVLVACLVLLYIVVPQFGGFAESFGLLRSAHWLPVALSVALIVMSYGVAAVTYQLLALRPLRYRRTVLVQGASAFANRILPAGLGGLTLNVQYLRKQRHTLPQAVVVASTNNLLGFTGHVLLMLCALLVGGTALLPTIEAPHATAGMYGVLGVLLVGLGVALSIRRVRHKVTGSLRALAKQFARYRKRPLRLAAALCSSLALTLITISVFYLAGAALDSPMGIGQAFVIFTAGIVVGTAVPTPGGLGGVEAGLVAASIAYGQDASLALATALLFRLLTYWVPLLPGFGLFMATRKYYA